MADWNLSDAYTDQKAETIRLEIGPALYEYLMKESDFAATIQSLRKSVLQERGVYLPAVRIKTGSAEEPNRYVIRIRGRRVRAAGPPPSGSGRCRRDTRRTSVRRACEAGASRPHVREDRRHSG